MESRWSSKFVSLRLRLVQYAIAILIFVHSKLTTQLEGREKEHA